LTHLYKQRVIVFFKTKRQCHKVAIIMGLLGLKACELHGNLSQTQRIQAFMDFKEDKYDYLLATDLASRGLDIKEVQTVVNFELPTHLTKYIHRIGRTARAGCVGTSLTLCNDSECLELKRMSKKTGDRLFRLNVNDSSVRQCQQSIARLHREIEVIMAQEWEERNIRKA
jgi:ATP-dependent RNA helicase DDX27